MAQLLKGAPVAGALLADAADHTRALLAKGIQPTLAIVRVGEQPDDLSYERGAIKRCAEAGVLVRTVPLPAGTDQRRLEQVIRSLNQDPAVHGILLMQPLPSPLDDLSASRCVETKKDVDGITALSQAGVYNADQRGYSPCTAQAILELLKYYEIPLQGAHVVVVGRSLVVGRPAAMLLLDQGATVTLCHRQTKDLAAVTRRGDIVVAAMGKMGFLGREYFSPSSVVIDTGIHYDETARTLRGDVDYEEVCSHVSALTPVPGGLGSVTTAVLARQVVQAAERGLMQQP